MATTAPSSTLIALSAPPRASESTNAASTGLALPRRRRMTPEKGRAVEMLGHAIEYLGDEFALDCRSSFALALLSEAQRKHPQIEAIQLLMARNREVYLSCPEVPSMLERIKNLLRVAGVPRHR